MQATLKEMGSLLPLTFTLVLTLSLLSIRFELLMMSAVHAKRAPLILSEFIDRKCIVR